MSFSDRRRVNGKGRGVKGKYIPGGVTVAEISNTHALTW